jgi:hypothetical protein
MKIKINLAALRRSTWYEYVIRFTFGGAVTALTGIIAKHYGPAIGGLFLAFPAIFPASATLIEKHEKQKARLNAKGRVLRARKAAGVDAFGATLGSVGLGAFAFVVWRWLPSHSASAVLSSATAVWFLVAASLWVARPILCRSLRDIPSKPGTTLSESGLRSQSPVRRRNE